VLDVVFTAPPSGTGRISGELLLQAAPNSPTSKDDCKKVGWRTVETEQGQPFPDQGACVSWVTSRSK
jgi:hypothetical protein